MDLDSDSVKKGNWDWDWTDWVRIVVVVIDWLPGKEWNFRR